MDDRAVIILKKYNLKLTAGRVALLKVMIESERPISHKEICSRLENLNYDQVSIYRSLDSFIKAGFVHKVEDEKGTWLYALCTCDNRAHCHPHFFCSNCGKCECLDDYKIPDLANLTNDYVIEEQRYYLKGICSKCKSV